MPGPTRSISAWLRALAPLAALCLLILGTAAVEYATVEPDSRAFLTPRNFANIARQWSFVGIVAVGMTYVIILGGIDLSVGSAAALVAGLGLEALNRAASADWSPLACTVLAAGIMLAGGLGLGLLNGLGVTLGRLAPFIATLATMAAYRSVVLAMADGSEIRSSVSGFGALGTGSVPTGLPDGLGGRLALGYPVLVFLALALVAELVLRRTSFGMAVRAIGGNPVAAKYAGVRATRVTLAVYAVSGFCAGLAALLVASRMNSVASSTMGLMWELDAIAAVVIGGTAMGGGRGSVLGTVVGVLILGVIQNMLNMLEVSTHLQGLIKGCMIVAAVLVQRIGARGV